MQKLQTANLHAGGQWSLDNERMNGRMDGRVLTVEGASRCAVPRQNSKVCEPYGRGPAVLTSHVCRRKGYISRRKSI